GTLPRVVTRDQVTAYPALVDAGNTVDVRLFETEAEARAAMLRGTRRLLLLQVPSGVRSIADRLPNERKLAMSRSPYPGIGGQLAALIYPQFVSETGLRRLPDLVRYLRAISRRLDTTAADPGRDAERMAVVCGVTEAYQQTIADLPAARRSGQDVQAVRWMIE